MQDNIYHTGKIIIADIGAADYSLDKRWLGLKNDVSVILFEPDKRSHKDLKAQGLTIYPFALYKEHQKKTLYLTKKPQCSSFYKPNMSFLINFPDSERWNIVDEVELEVIPLDSLQLNIDFIKIDTQGSELDILKGAEGTLENVLGAEIEVSFSEIYTNQPLFGEVCAYMKFQGFEFYDFSTEYRYGRKKLDRMGQLSFADALFLRTPENLKRTNPAKTEKYNSIVKAYGKEDLIIF